MTDEITARKVEAQTWFETLRDRICAAFESLEDSLSGPNAERFPDIAPGRFERKSWERTGGGGTCSGCNASTGLFGAVIV